jgi:two-component system sensor histidine kinase BaeS
VSGVVYLAMPLPAGGLPAGLVAQLGGAILLTGLLAGLTGLYLARRIARPIEQVAGAASAVSAGNLGRRVDLHSGVGELDRLGQAFDRMSESLQRSDQAKIAFIADVTHELRTPLTVIKGTLETLEDGALDDVVGRGPLLEAMGTETERLIRLVNDLLVLTRADAGSLDLDLRPLDLDDLARWRCENLAPLAARKQVKLLAGVEAQSCWVNGDADRLTQVLDNLLDNALRHSPAGGVVQVETRRVGEEIVCCVSDQGPGIPAEHLPHIFERFYRADASRGRMSGGAGLGLAIARSLVQAHGGRIQVESRAGEGACFSLYLPAIAGDCPPTDTQLTSS